VSDDALKAEIDRLWAERDKWQEEARQYCENAKYWRAEVERLLALLAEARTLLLTAHTARPGYERNKLASRIYAELAKERP
jgi:hypothetical protein